MCEETYCASSASMRYKRKFPIFRLTEGNILSKTQVEEMKKLWPSDYVNSTNYVEGAGLERGIGLSHFNCLQGLIKRGGQ